MVSKKKDDVISFKSRPCNVRVSKLHPNAYSKEELVKLAVDVLKYTESQSKRKSKDELCIELSKGIKKTPTKKTSKEVVVPEKKTPTKKTAVSKKTSLTVSKKKATPKKVAITKSSSKASSLEEVVTITPKKKATAKKSQEKILLHPHQTKIEDYLLRKRGVVAAFSTGSGKTLTAINAAFKLLNNPKSKIKKVLIVTNKSLISRFEEDIVKYGEDPEDKRITFISKEMFGRKYESGDIRCNENLFLIIDEVHNFKSTSKAQRALAAIGCSKKAGKVLLMTATPVYNDVFDIINLAAMVKGEEPLTKTEFSRLSDVEKIKYFRCVFSFYESLKEDENYPKIREHNVKIKMTPEYQKKYQDIETRQINLEGERVLDQENFNPFLFYSGIRQATNSLSPCLKCIWVADKLLKDKNKKSVLYSFYNKRGTNIMKETLNQNKIKFVEITGEIDDKKRKEHFKQFNDEHSGINVLVISSAGGEGLDLKGVRNIIILEAGFNRAGEEQIIGRGARYRSHTHLPKSEHFVDVYYLILEKLNPDPLTKMPPKHLSADEKLKQVIDKKYERTSKLKKIMISQSIENQKC